MHHLQVLVFRLLVFGALQWLEEADLEGLWDVFVAGTHEASWCTFLVVDLACLVRRVVLNRHRLVLEIFANPAAAVDNS